MMRKTSIRVEEKGKVKSESPKTCNVPLTCANESLASSSDLEVTLIGTLVDLRLLVGRIQVSMLQRRFRKSSIYLTRFKQLTSRNEVAISSNDYKFYSPRHKYRCGSLISLPNIQDIPSYSGAESSTTTQGFLSPQNQQQNPNKHHLQSLPHQPQFHPVLQSNQIMHQSQHAGPYSHNNQNGSSMHLYEISHSHQPSISQHMSCLQSLTGGHVGGHMHMLVMH